MTTLHVVPTPEPCRVSNLARTFPTMHQAEGLDPFDPDVFDAWAQKGLSRGAVFAAQFILTVWSGRAGRLSDKPRKTPAKDTWHGVHRWNLDSHWRIGPFDVVDAMGTWDAAHRNAFVAWAQDPWFP